MHRDKKDKSKESEEEIEEVEDVENTDVTEGKEAEQKESSKNGEVDYKDKYLRLLSEYSNFQRQKDEEIKSMAKFGNKNLLIKVIDILDDIEMGLIQENLSEETKNILTMLHSKLHHLLSLEGVTEIKLSIGDDYDPSVSEVLTTVEDEKNKGKIAHIARKGYMMSERVLRTAKVIIGK